MEAQRPRRCVREHPAGTPRDARLVCTSVPAASTPRCLGAPGAGRVDRLCLSRIPESRIPELCTLEWPPGRRAAVGLAEQRAA